jgi:hypothetical protein
VSLQKNKVKRASYEQALGGNPLVLKTDTSGRAVVDSLVASQIAGRYIVTASLAAVSAGLGINDKSLVWGGYFDIRATFDVDAERPKHSLHRVGLSVDINHNAMNEDQIAKLTELMNRHQGFRYREEQIHYGFNGGH